MRFFNMNPEPDETPPESPKPNLCEFATTDELVEEIISRPNTPAMVMTRTGEEWNAFVSDGIDMETLFLFHQICLTSLFNNIVIDNIKLGRKNKKLRKKIKDMEAGDE